MSREREVRRAVCEYAVPLADKGKKAVCKMPPLSPYYLAKVATDVIGEDDGFVKNDWRQILKAVVYDHEAPPIIKRLSLEVAYAEVGRIEGLGRLLDSIKDFLSFNGHALPPVGESFDKNWLPVNWVPEPRAVRRAYPNKADLQALADVEYFNGVNNGVKECWSAGTQAIKPAEENWLYSESPDPAKRVPALRAFAQVMRAWPRAAEILVMWEEHWDGAAEVPHVDSDEFRELERAIWVCYLQSYYDYRGRVAPVPYTRPVPPLEEDSSPA
ncbi:hypothetical protein AURDEDRAFT_167866 [Auricularia subglabra TFB-10046 SS5]|nr:hypothetical protein AURDEDRAFT_167866 [Auricularia subglabra TFB-10046 SS5]